MRLGGMEIVILVLLAVLLFGGAKKLPQLGKNLGSGLRGFKKGLKDIGDDEIEKEMKEVKDLTKNAGEKKKTK